MKLGKNVLQFQAGQVRATIFGGRFVDYTPGTRRLVGVKMAEEINHPHDISIPTRDFDVPSEDDMQLGVFNALRAIHHGNDIYAGCMGGIGRTGLFFGCMAKVMIDYYEGTVLYDLNGDKTAEFSDPIVLTRTVFKAHAIETTQQMSYVKNFDTSKAVAYLHSIQPDMSKYMQRSQHNAIASRLSVRVDQAWALNDKMNSRMDALRRRRSFRFFSAIFGWEHPKDAVTY